MYFFILGVFCCFSSFFFFPFISWIIAVSSDSKSLLLWLSRMRILLIISGMRVTVVAVLFCLDLPVWNCSMQLLMIPQFTKYTRFWIDWAMSYMKKKKYKEHFSGLFNHKRKVKQTKTISWIPFKYICITHIGFLTWITVSRFSPVALYSPQDEWIMLSVTMLDNCVNNLLEKLQD